MILAIFALAARTSGQSKGTLPSGQNDYYIGNCPPLKPSPLYKLPIGSIRPQGWLKVQLLDEANGETGHLEEISPWLDKRNNAWITPSGLGDHGWEEVPYWLKGFGDLGYILKDPRIIDHARAWIDGVLSTQSEDGYFGPRSNLTANNGKPDVWPNMVMLFALQSAYEWRRDPRILGFMSRYFKWEQTIPDSDMFLSYWEKQRGGDNIASVYWLYNRTGDRSLLDLVRKIHRVGADWVKGVPNWHGVNFAQGFREPEEFAQLDASVAGAKSTESDYEAMRTLYGQVPGGMYGADENVRSGHHDPRQGTETCAMVEMMLSDEMLLTDDGDPKWADRCEDVAFNSLPAALTADEKALHYLTAPNLVEIDAQSKAPGFQNSGPMLLFNPYDHRCCQHNVSHGWPYFSENLWMATNQNGLAATIYAPSTVRAKVGDGTEVEVVEDTAYPFRDSIRFYIQTPKPVAFPLSLRIPAWAENPTITYKGRTHHLASGSRFVTARPTWTNGDMIVLKLPMKIKLEKWAQNGGAVSVSRGPLSYGLKIGEKLVKSAGTKDAPATSAFPAWEIHPTSAWNYGLEPRLYGLKVIEKPYDPDRQPFALERVPVEIEVSGREIPEWKEDATGLCAVLQKSPAYTTARETRLTLVPMGAARLRISEFPTVSAHADAVHWIPSRPRSAPIPARSSHTFEGDTLDALSSGLDPASSHDGDIPRFTWWDHRGSPEWVEYDFPTLREVKSVSVYWFDDQATGGRCRTPESWSLQYWEDGAWKEVSPPSDVERYGVALDRFNSVNFVPVKTQKLRIAAKLKPEFSAGILQWKVQ